MAKGYKDLFIEPDSKCKHCSHKNDLFACALCKNNDDHFAPNYSAFSRKEVKEALNRVYGVPVHIKNVIFNNPATIVLWSDGTKTVVKCQEGDEFDKEKGLAMAICKKFTANNKGNYCNIFKKWIK